MKMSNWHKRRTRRLGQDQPVTAIPSVSWTDNRGVLIFYDDDGRRLVITMTHAEFRTLAQNMLNLLKDAKA